MKVSEAKEKVCPFSIQYGGAPSSKDVGGFGLHKGDMLASRCICSDCMAWKWDKEYKNGCIVGYSKTDGYCSRVEQ